MRRSSNLQIKHLIHTWQRFSEYGTSNVSNSIRSPGKNCTAEERGNKINVCGSQKKKNRRERPSGKKRVNPMLWPEFLQLLIRRLRGLHVISARPNTLAHTHSWLSASVESTFVLLMTHQQLPEVFDLWLSFWWNPSMNKATGDEGSYKMSQLMYYT